MVCQPVTQELAAFVTNWQTSIFHSHGSSALSSFVSDDESSAWLGGGLASGGGFLPTLRPGGCRLVPNTELSKQHQRSEQPFNYIFSAEKQQISRLTPTLLAGGGEVLVCLNR